MNKLKSFNAKSLQQIANVTKEASLALNNKQRTIKDSDMSSVLNGVLNGILPLNASFLTLYSLGESASTATKVTGLAIASGALFASGMATVAAPVIGLAVAGAAIPTSILKKKQLYQEEKILFNKSQSLIKEIEKEIREGDVLNKDRLDYLRSLNILLSHASKDLKNDLKR